MNAPAVELRNITKKFGSFVALDSVSLKVAPGSVHAVVGENGAGKTTLMRVLQGTYKAESGDVILNDQSLHLRSAQDGYAHQIGMVSQHYSIIPELTCLQNLMLGAEPGLVVNLHQAAERATKLADDMGFQFDWHQSAEALSPAGAQKLELLKLLWRDATVMILDEPTAMLSPSDAEALYGNLRELATSGHTIIVVTHRLNEVLDHCDAITVLRGGKHIADRAVSGTSANELAELIVGQAMAAPPEIEAPTSSTPTLELDQVTVLGHRGDEALKNATFQLREGEMVGLAGVDGNGQRELFHAIFGTSPLVSGSVRFRGQEIQSAPVSERIGLGFRLIAEDRHTESVIEDWNLIDNAALGYQRRPELRNGPRINQAARSSFAEKVIQRLGTKCRSSRSTMKSLSGGNQQRLVAARSLEYDPRLILAFQPTRGLDIAGTRAVYDQMRDSCRNGASALVVSFDLDELLEHCDRVIAINRGRIVEMPAGKERDRAEIGRWMVVE